MQEKDPHNILIYTVTMDINSELSATCTIVSFPDHHQNPDTEGLGTRLCALALWIEHSPTIKLAQSWVHYVVSWPSQVAEDNKAFLP